MSNNSDMKNSMIQGTLYKGVSILLSLVYVPVVLDYLGDYKYGVWATVLSILSWISYFDLGIGNGLRNRLSEALASSNSKNDAKTLVSSAYAILSLVVLAISVVCGFGISFIDWSDLLSAWNINENLVCIMEISFLGMCFSFVLMLCNNVFYALQKAQIVNLMAVFQQGVMLLSVWLLSLTRTNDLTAVAILYVLSNVLVYGGFTVYIFVKNRLLSPSLKCVDKKVAKDLGGLGLKFFIAQIAALILFTTDNLIISNLFGPEQVTIYSTANKVFTVIISLFAALVVPLWSKTTVDFARRDIYEIKRTLGKMLKLFILAAVGAGLLAVLFKPLVALWLGRDLGFSWSLILMMGLYAIVYMWNTIWSQIINGLTLVNFMVAVACIQAAANIPLSFLFARTCGFGIEGVLLGTILTMAISSIAYPVYTHYVLSRAEREVELLNNN